MAVVRYLVKKENISVRAKSLEAEVPIVLIGSEERSMYLITVGTFHSDVYVSVFNINENGVVGSDLAILEQKINDPTQIITETEKIVTNFTNNIDNKEKEFEENSFFVCDNPECSEHLVYNPFCLDGKLVCSACGEAVREVAFNEVEEIDYERLREIASILILELMEEYGVSIYEMENELGIDSEEIDYITSY